MGGKCSPSGGIYIQNIEFDKSHINDPINDRSLKNIKEREGPPNSRTDLYHGDELIQSRWYGPDGWAILDRHYKHNDPFKNHKWPHDQEWLWKWNKKKQKMELEIQKALPELRSDFC
jgi:hypothetical protein